MTMTTSFDDDDDEEDDDDDGDVRRIADIHRKMHFD